MYIHTPTLQYPLTEFEIRAMFPDTSFPVNFTPPDEFSHVFEFPKPEYNALTSRVEEMAPTLTAQGTWQQNWRVVALTLAEVAINIANAGAKLQATVVQQVQDRLDQFAKTRNYDSIMSACTYVTSSVPRFATDGAYCVSVRDQTWATLYSFLAEVQAGTKPMPSSYADVEPILPKLVWPL